jgi:hypothetical protein
MFLVFAFLSFSFFSIVSCKQHLSRHHPVHPILVCPVVPVSYLHWQIRSFVHVLNSTMAHDAKVIWIVQHWLVHVWTNSFVSFRYRFKILIDVTLNRPYVRMERLAFQVSTVPSHVNVRRNTRIQHAVSYSTRKVSSKCSMATHD